MSSLEEKDVLIIEDSPAVGILLKEFLNRLGMKKIRHCHNGKTGIESFMELVEAGQMPLVFLDYNLPDMTALSIMTQMLALRPDVKVIIETARERSEESIKDVIAHGAYQYLPKPIRLEKLKEIIDTLKIEEASENVSESLEKLASGLTQISILRIQQQLNKDEKEIMPQINRLIESKKLVQINDIKEVSCPKCSSVRVTQTFHCPKCNGTNFKQDKIIEHYKCGNVSSSLTYTDDKCPKCHHQIKVFGVDYRVQENMYKCNECSEIFSELLSNYLCMRCNERFKLEDAKILSSRGFSWIK